MSTKCYILLPVEIEVEKNSTEDIPICLEIKYPTLAEINLALDEGALLWDNYDLAEEQLAALEMEISQEFITGD